MQAFSSSSYQTAVLHRADPHAQHSANEDLFSAIQYADEADATTLIEKSLENGANIHAVNHNGHGVLELAVIHNKIRVFKYLLAKNAFLPQIRHDEFDLLMHTAVNGQTDIGAALIEKAGLTVNASDVYGMTALHYAVKNKHLETARMLIDHGADLNTMTVGLPQNQLGEIFGDTYNLSGDNITPLLIAVAQGNHEMVKLFISYNETIYISAVHPLLLALKNSDHQMLRILLGHFNHSARNIPSKNQLFNWAILHQADPCCLQILQDMYPLDQNDPAYNQSLLAQAIQHGNHAAAEYFIAQGIQPDDQPFAGPLWEKAAGLQDRYHMLDLLSRCASSKWKHLNTDHGKKSLHLICQTEPTMAAFASIGICPLISKQIINRATQVNTNALALTETQKMIDTAWFFADSLTTSASVNPAARSVLPPTHFPTAHGHADFPNAHSAEQVLALKKIGQALLEDYLQRLTACLHYDYFSASGEEADFVDEQIILIRKKLEAELGVPATVSAYLAHAWESTIMLRSTSAYDAHSSIIETSEFIFQLKRNLDTTLMHLPQTDQLAKLSLEAINQIALQTDSELPVLRSDPASALRTLENRSNLQDVNLTGLQAALCQHYGIPSKLAEIVAQCWGAAITEVRQADNWHTPARMHLALKTALATNLSNKLHAYDATFAAATISRQRSIVRDLLAYCETMQVERSDSVGKHARRAEPSPAPLSKKPRNE